MVKTFLGGIRMSDQIYRLCCQYRGKVVRIHDRFGRVHVGRIVNVNRHKVFIQPFIRRNPGGFGYYGGYYGGYGGYWGAPFALALGFIAGIALAGLFFW